MHALLSKMQHVVLPRDSSDAIHSCPLPRATKPLRINGPTRLGAATEAGWQRRAA